MFRETATQAAGVHDDEQVRTIARRDGAVPRPVETTAGAALALPAAPLFRAAEAVPDIPAAVGKMLFACYLALVGALAIATAGPGESGFALVVAALFVVAFFTVPRLFLAQEAGEGRRVTMDQFLARGVDTFTGHCSGGAALVQMFVVPVLLTLGVLSIAIIVSIVG